MISSSLSPPNLGAWGLKRTVLRYVLLMMRNNQESNNGEVKLKDLCDLEIIELDDYESSQISGGNFGNLQNSIFESLREALSFQETIIETAFDRF